MSYIYISLLHLLHYYLNYVFFKILVISKIHLLFGLKMNEDDVCLVDCATATTIKRHIMTLCSLTLLKNVNN